MTISERVILGMEKDIREYEINNGYSELVKDHAYKYSVYKSKRSRHYGINHFLNDFLRKYKNTKRRVEEGMTYEECLMPYSFKSCIEAMTVVIGTLKKEGVVEC